MKPDEIELLVAIYLKPKDVRVRGVVNVFYESGKMHYRRAWYLLSKWNYKDWYEWGVTLDMGWLEESGKQKARELLLSMNQEEVEHLKTLMQGCERGAVEA